MTLSLSWDDVLHWRCRQQWLHRPAEAADPVAVVERLAGVQAQVASCAEQAVAARQGEPDPGSVRQAVQEQRLVKTWSVRGTLHLLEPKQAPAQLALIGAARTWEKGVWQKTFVTVAQMDAMAAAAQEALDGHVLTREQLTAAIVEHAKDPSLEEHLRSGWGAVLKPLSWQGLLIYGPNSDDNRVTFTRPSFRSMQPDEAASIVVPAYLGAYGPASRDTFDQWLIRGQSKKAMLRQWFAGLHEDGLITEVDVEGERLWARTEDLESLAAKPRFDEVRLLPAFDQFVLGPGTADTRTLPKQHRAEVSRAGGWISPVVAYRGRIAGIWGEDGETLWDKVPAAKLAKERKRVT
ncbi:DNA glycosylase AlkZ-like family protein [Dactylosporangium sp. CS-033363]|uniref:DNA glycosylase AlkZ-like family protein n=1 Tax=Dactylosporangium sp. CS-033363 TaxID=3239935 RepID=UPI003D8B83BC